MKHIIITFPLNYVSSRKKENVLDHKPLSDIPLYQKPPVTIP